MDGRVPVAASRKHGFGYNKMQELDQEEGSPPPSYSYSELKKERTNHLKRQESHGVEGMTLSWRQVVVTTKDERGCLQYLPCSKANGDGMGPKQILKGVSGVIHPGTLQVIMGASGSGKTTLLNVLTRRNLDAVDVEGQVLVNGRDIGDDIATVSAYIQQDDLMIGTLTVREHLWFNAVLRMDRDYTDDQRRERIADVMLEMGLQKCADTAIGVPGFMKGLSGGEMKRLAFSTALLTRPSILVCDEPTSGLDSFMAQNVVQALNDLSKRGRTVLCTIHQPSSQVFEMFDQILLMGEGRTAYMGPTSELSSFFSELGFECPHNYNPADFFVQTLAIVPGEEAESRALLQRICNEFDSSTHARSLKWQLESVSSQYDDKFTQEMDAMEKQYGYMAGWLLQFAYCWWRANVDIFRNKRAVVARLGYLALTGLVLGLLYLQQTVDQLGTSNLNSALFVLSIQVCYNTCFTICAGFSREYPVFLREHHDRTYSSTAYYLAKSLTDYPFIIIGSFFYAAISYWMIGLNPHADRFLIATAMLILLGMVATALGHAGGSLFPNPQIALTFLPFYMGLMLLFSGFLMKDGTFLVVFWPLQQLSHFKYGYEALVINQWEDVQHIECEYEDDSSQYIQTNQTVKDACLHNGRMVLDTFQYKSADLPYCFLYNALLVLGFEIIGIVVFWIKAKKK